MSLFVEERYLNSDIETYKPKLLIKCLNCTKTNRPNVLGHTEMKARHRILELSMIQTTILSIYIIRFIN